MKRKTEKIINDIVLSVKYSRLKEEAGGTEEKKRAFLGGVDKKKEKNNEFIESVYKEIDTIEQNNNKSDYSLIEENKAKQQLQLLSKQKNFELIKYSIAIEIILNDDFEYSSKTADFNEKISLIIFNDKSIIKKMEDDYRRIANRIYGMNTAKTIVDNLAKVATPIKALAFVGVAAIRFAAGNSIFSNQKQAKKLSALSSSDFAKRLIICAMDLLYAKNHFKSEIEYANIFKNKLKEINLERKIIMKELFEERYEVENNRLKMELLQNFDNYLVEQIN